MTVLGVREQKPVSFVRSTSHLLLGSLAAQVLVVATFAVIARGLGKPVFGLTVALLGAGAVGQDLLDFGTSQWLSRELAAGRLTDASVRAMLRRRTRLSWVVSGAVALALVAAGLAWPLALAGAAYVVAAIDNMGAHARVRATGHFRRSAVHLVAERMLWLVLALAVLSAPAMSRSSTASCLVGAMAVSYLASVLCFPRGDRAARSPMPLAELYRRSAAFGLLGLSSDLQQLDSTLAAGIAGVSVAAEVGIASKLTGPVGLVAGSISQVAFRGVARGGADADRTTRTALQAAGTLGLLVALVSPVLPLVASIVLGQASQHAGLTIVVFCLGTAVAVVNQPMASMLAAAGRDRAVSLVIAASVVGGLAIGGVTVGQLGSVGMALGFVVTQMAVCVGCIWLTVRGRR